MPLVLNFINFEELATFGLSLIFLNIVNYLIVFLPLITIIMFCNVSKLKSINQFKELNSYNFILYTVILSVLSMAGIPPLLGFTGKFLSIIFLNFKAQYLLLLLTIILNMFSMYFYIQNLRFLVKKNKSSILNYNNCYAIINNSLVVILIFLNILNIFGFLFISEFLIIYNNIVSNIYY